MNWFKEGISLTSSPEMMLIQRGGLTLVGRIEGQGRGEGWGVYQST